MSTEQIQVVRSGSAPSLSGRSTINYDIGTLGDIQYIRLSGNSGGGLYCKEWVAVADAQALLAGNPSVSSKTLQPIYAGKSANSPGFLLAVIVKEKLCSVPNTTQSVKTAKVKTPAKDKKSSKAAK
jgi:hypothetical protein